MMMDSGVAAEWRFAGKFRYRDIESELDVCRAYGVGRSSGRDTPASAAGYIFFDCPHCPYRLRWDKGRLKKIII
jgi:hypothetical protein